MRSTLEPHTLVFPVRKGEILLGMKKRGLGIGRWNGFGGKVETGESLEQAAARELNEESGLQSAELIQAGILALHYPHIGTYIKAVVFYTNQFNGEQVETSEMQPRWFETSSIPFNQMWPDDKLWLPLMLAGKKFEANFIFRDFDTITDYSIEEML